jgi:hypothetical protein
MGDGECRLVFLASGDDRNVRVRIAVKCRFVVFASGDDRNVRVRTCNGGMERWRLSNKLAADSKNKRRQDFPMIHEPKKDRETIGVKPAWFVKREVSKRGSFS